MENVNKSIFPHFYLYVLGLILYSVLLLIRDSLNLRDLYIGFKAPWSPEYYMNSFFHICKRVCDPHNSKNHWLLVDGVVNGVSVLFLFVFSINISQHAACELHLGYKHVMTNFLFGIMLKMLHFTKSIVNFSN